MCGENVPCVSKRIDVPSFLLPHPFRMSSSASVASSLSSDTGSSAKDLRGPLILFGTQTGNAEAISKMLATGLDGIPNMPKARVLSMTDYTKQEKDVRTHAPMHADFHVFPFVRSACSLVSLSMFGLDRHERQQRSAPPFLPLTPFSSLAIIKRAADHHSLQVCAGLLKETAVIILCSTTGNGDPPDNARPFIRQLRQKTDPSTLKGFTSFFFER